MARAERRATIGEGLTGSENDDANVEEEEETEEGGERGVADPTREERRVTPDNGEVQSEESVPEPEDDNLYSEDNEQVPDFNGFEDDIPDSNRTYARDSVQGGEYPAKDEYPEPSTLNQRGTRLLDAAQILARDDAMPQPHGIPPTTNYARLRSIRVIMETVAEEVRRLVESYERFKNTNAPLS